MCLKGKEPTGQFGEKKEKKKRKKKAAPVGIPFSEVP